MMCFTATEVHCSRGSLQQRIIQHVVLHCNRGSLQQRIIQHVVPDYNRRGDLRTIVMMHATYPLFSTRHAPTWITAPDCLCRLQPLYRFSGKGSEPQQPASIYPFSVLERFPCSLPAPKGRTDTHHSSSRQCQPSLPAAYLLDRAEAQAALDGAVMGR